MSSTSSFHAADYAVFAISLVLSLGIGLYHACTGGKQKTAGEYLMGDRKLALLPVSISILVSVISANTLLGVPAEMYAYGINYWLMPIGLIPACFGVAFTFVPLLFPLKIISCYEYLQLRFKSRIPRRLASALLILKQMLYIGVVLFGPATALEAVTRLPAYASIIAVAFVATLYTALGGMKAVIWTDVFQSAIMLAGLIAILIQGTIQVGGMRKVFEINVRDKRIDFSRFFDLDFTIRYSFWSLTIGYFAYWMGEYGVNQPTAQRYCALPTINKSKLSMILNAPGFVVIQTLCALVGVVAYAYYAERGCDPFYTGRIKNPNQILPLFTMDVLGYPGLPGLMMACIFSGSLSTVSSSLNSMAACVWEDFLKTKFGHLPESRVTFIMKVLVFIFGGICLGFAFFVATVGGTTIQLSSSFVGVALGPMIGLFTLGGMLTCTNALGALFGGLAGVAFPMWMMFGQFSLGLQNQRLPGRTHGCYPNATINSTYFTGDYTTAVPTTPMSVHNLRGINRLYSVSFVWFPVIGFLVTMIVGTLVSVISARCARFEVQKEFLCSCIRSFAGVEKSTDDDNLEKDKPKLNAVDTTMFMSDTSGYPPIQRKNVKSYDISNTYL